MKMSSRAFVALLSFAALIQGSVASAHDVSVMEQIQNVSRIQSQLDLIDWKVGDRADYKISISGLPFGGSSYKEVTKDEGAAIWVTQEVNLLIQKQKIEMLLNKADGQILRMIQDGKEVAVPQDEIEIISQEYGDVTVPAGTFKAIHITANTSQVKNVEIWVNPKDTVMDGSLKQVIPQQNMKITMELTSFKKN